MSEIWNLNAICRCCHADGSFTDLSSPCTVNDSEIIITDIIKYTFAIHLQSPIMEASNSICDECLKHLREAAIFKKTIEECEQKFEEYYKNELFHRTNIKYEDDENDDNGLPMIKYELADNETVEVPIETEWEKIQVQTQKEEILKVETNECDVVHSNYDLSVIKYELEGEVPSVTSDVGEEPEEEENDLQSKKDYVEVECHESKNTKNIQSEDEIKCTIKNDKHICKYCQKHLKNPKSLKKHISVCRTKKLTCKICELKFKKHITFDRHMKKHSMCANPNLPFTKMTSFECRDCDKSYNTLPKLRNHRYTIHQKSKKVFICDICQKEFPFKDNLRKHILVHMGANRLFMCDTCGNRFNDKTNLNKHYATVHLKLKEYKCKLCPKAYASKKTLVVHIRKHTGERPFKCEFCPESFADYTYLKKHKIKHDKKIYYGGKYVCKLCKSVFNHRGLYAAHLRTHGRTIYRCLQCDRSFVNNFCLTRHLSLHNDKDVPCDICQKKFTKKSDMLSHKSKSHGIASEKKKVLKFSCHLCKRAVRDIDKHMNIHFKRCHKCEFCDKSYPERNTLNRHVSLIHNGFRFKCDICGKDFMKRFSLNKHKRKVHKINEEE